MGVWGAGRRQQLPSLILAGSGLSSWLPLLAPAALPPVATSWEGLGSARPLGSGSIQLPASLPTASFPTASFPACSPGWQSAGAPGLAYALMLKIGYRVKEKWSASKESKRGRRGGDSDPRKTGAQRCLLVRFLTLSCLFHSLYLQGRSQHQHVSGPCLPGDGPKPPMTACSSRASDIPPGPATSPRGQLQCLWHSPAASFQRLSKACRDLDRNDQRIQTKGATEDAVNLLVRKVTDGDVQPRGQGPIPGADELPAGLIPGTHPNLGDSRPTAVFCD